MQRDLRQLLRIEQPVAAYGRIVGGDRFERPFAEMPREDDVDDVARRSAASAGLIDSTTAIGPSSGRSSSIPHLLGQLALKGVDEGLAAVHAAPRKQPVLATVLLVTAEQDPVAAPEQSRHAEPRLHHAPVEPKPSAPRARSPEAPLPR